jgi:hypothetical protein
LDENWRGTGGVGSCGIHVCVDGNPESAAEGLATLVASREGAALSAHTQNTQQPVRSGEYMQPFVQPLLLTVVHQHQDS